MTWAIMGLPHPFASPTGWAWVRVAQNRASLQAAPGPASASGAASESSQAEPSPEGADKDSAIVANAVAEFVERTLRQLEGGADQQSMPGSESADEAAEPPQRRDVRALASMGGNDLAGEMERWRERAVEKRLAQVGVIGKVSDASLARGSSAVSYMMQQVGVVRMAREAVLEMSV
jgi:hypothetical protein